MSQHPRRATPTLRFPPEPRRRRHRWLVVGLALAGAALLAAVQGQPVTEPAMLSTASVTGEVGHPGELGHPLDVGAPSLPSTTGPSATGSATTGSGREDDDPAALDDAPGAAGTYAATDGGHAAGTPATNSDAGRDDRTHATGGLPPVLGTVDGLELRQPAADALVTGFHEASSASYAIDPVGRLVSNENVTRFEPPSDRPDGVDYHILSSRGRIHPPTSAVDVVLRDEVPVLAPVSGVVADVRSYHLYGRHADHRIEIHPDRAPAHRVVLVHVDDVRVREGDRVEAGITVLAGSANRFPFTSQIDRETEPDRWPHVHLEVQPIDAPRPGDDLPDG